MTHDSSQLLYLVRHGENRANLTREFSYKAVDYSLNQTGLAQAAKTAAWFADRTFDAVYCSPLKRAVETATVIAAVHGLKPIVCDEFRELNVGDLEIGPTSEEKWQCHDHVIASWMNGRYDVAFPNGEDFHSAFGRLRKGLAIVTGRQRDRPCVIVGHFGLLNITMQRICSNFSLAQLEQKGHPNCAVTTIRLSSDGPSSFSGELVEWACSDHL